MTVYNATWGYVGETAASASQMGNTLFYTGHKLDAATGLYYMRARYYDPASGAVHEPHFKRLQGWGESVCVGSRQPDQRQRPVGQ